jgi:large subunit ribosomal protein L18
MVVRTSNQHTTVQFVEAKLEGDLVLASAKSSELTKEYGWGFSTGNLPASYLTGLLAGKRALDQGLQKAILDIGLKGSSKGARVFGALKGALDAGVEIPHGKEVLPEETRLRGEHISAYSKTLSEKEHTGFQFAQYSSKKSGPEVIPMEFEKIKERIATSEKQGQKTEKKK